MGLVSFESLSVALKTKATRYETATDWLTVKRRWLLTRSTFFRALETTTGWLTESASARAQFSRRELTMTPIGQREFAICSGCNGVSSTSAARIRQTAQIDRFKADAALRTEQQRITDVRMASIPPHRRPQYPPTERMAILELKAARAWSLEQTAKAFLVTPRYDLLVDETP